VRKTFFQLFFCFLGYKSNDLLQPEPPLKVSKALPITNAQKAEIKMKNLQDNAEYAYGLENFDYKNLHTLFLLYK